MTSRYPTPPSETQRDIIMNPCGPLQNIPNVAPEDQCGRSSWFCEIITNWKHNEPRIIQASSLVSDKPVNAWSISDQSFALQYLSATKTVNVTFNCDTKSTPPSLTLYSEKEMAIHWSIPEACATSNDHPTVAQPTSSSWSGWRIFWLIVGIGIALYFILGSIYNIHVLNIRTFPDFLPNSEVWIALWALIQDAIASIQNRFSNRYVSL